MAKFIAFLNDFNVVTRVVQAPEDETKDWCKFYAELAGTTCIETTQDGSLRTKYADPGDVYHEDIDAFIEPQPYASWTLDRELKRWVAPVPMPAEGFCLWDEKHQKWIVVELPEVEPLPGTSVFPPVES